MTVHMHGVNQFCISSILVNKKTCVVGVEEGGEGGG